jgi:ATP-dependent exoDNAse (exonuclease V) alpha subunit
MAIYRLEAKIISRGSGGRSVIRAAAYRSGSMLHKAAYRSGDKLRDERAQDTFNYRPRAQEVLHTEIIAPKNGPTWLQAEPPKSKEDMHRQRPMRERLWNSIEIIEKRKDSRLAREFVLALPRELTLEQQIALVRGWCETEFISKGFVVDFAVHKSKLGLNPHAHVLCTTRPVEGEWFGKKPSTAGHFNQRGVVGVNGKLELHAWRDSWANHENAALEKAGRPERVDHRSLKARGIDRIPEPKMGPAATAMERRGLDPERSKLVRFVKSLNFSRPWLKAIERAGEVHQQGLGKTWWERSLIMAKDAGKSARETVLDTWAKMLHSRHPAGLVGQDIPPPSRGPDMSR